jgi:hypothetical protein
MHGMCMIVCLMAALNRLQRQLVLFACGWSHTLSLGDGRCLLFAPLQRINLLSACQLQL